MAVLELNATATTGPDGAFLFEGVPGATRLVRAEAAGYESVTRRVSLDGRDAYVEIVLPPLPPTAPYTVAIEHAGFVSCAGMARVGGETSEGTVVTCGERDPNDQRELEFELPLDAGIESVVLELSWEPGSQLASHFSFAVFVNASGAQVALGEAEGDGYVKLAIPRQVAREVLLPGAVLRTRVEPASSLLDEEAFLAVGAAVAQPYTVVATLFYHAPAPPGYRAVA